MFTAQTPEPGPTNKLLNNSQAPTAYGSMPLTAAAIAQQTQAGRMADPAAQAALKLVDPGAQAKDSEKPDLSSMPYQDQDIDSNTCCGCLPSWW